MAEEKTQFEQTDDLFDNNRYQEAIDLLKSFKVGLKFLYTY